MSKKNEFDNILNDCLERLIGGETIEACLKDYTEYAAELEPLLKTAVDARKVAAIEPRPEFRERAGHDFQAAIREIGPEKSPGFFGWFPRWATVVTAVVVVLLAAAGTVAASTSSLPDDPLYRVKLATEAVRLTFTPSALGKAELYASFADERVDEIVRMAEKGNVEKVEQATERMNDQLIAMSNLVLPGGVRDEWMEAATFEAAPAPRAVEEAPAPVPTPRPEPEAAQVPMEPPAPIIEIPPPATVEQDSAPVIITAPEPAEDVLKAGEAGMEEAEVEPDNQALLRMNVSEQAMENIEELLELLESAPDSLKPVILRALEVAIEGYEQALDNLY